MMKAAAFAVLLAACSSAAVAAAESPEALVERGKYLAAAGNCTSCHTRPDGEAFAGGVPFVTPFGTMYSTNITPDDETGIGKWTEAEFARAVREGVRPNGEHLYPAFPYTAFTKLSDADVAALYAFFKSVPAAKDVAPVNDMGFPYNQRWALGIWKAMFFDKGRYEPNKAQSAEWNRGAYLVEGLGHCSSCHSPRNFMGGERTSLAMTGGSHTDKIPTGELRQWSSPNLTSAPQGLKAWTVDDLTSYLKTGRTAFSETFGPMNEVIMNSTSHLSEADVRAMAVYIKSLPANGEPGKPASADVIQVGSNLYDVHCGTCHLPTGMGGDAENSGARLKGSPVVQAPNPAGLINVILHGPQLPDPPLPKRWKAMEGFADKLADDEIAALASFLRSSWGNVGGEVTASQVATQR